LNKWRKLWLLEAWERRLFVQSLLLLPLTGAALRFVSLKRWQSILARLSGSYEVPATTVSDPLARKARATARMVRAAVWHGPYHARCLAESLTLRWLLRQQGIASDLRFGSRKNAGRMEVHAWVEFMGVPLNDSRGVREHFAPFETCITTVGVES